MTDPGSKSESFETQATPTPPQAEGAAGEGELDHLARVAGHGLNLPAFIVSIVAGEEPKMRTSVNLPPLTAQAQRSLLYGLCLGVVDGEPLIVENTKSQHQSRELAALTAAGVESALCFPLRADGWRVIGLFCVVNRLPRRWREVELSLLTDLSQLAALEMRREIGMETASSYDLHLRARRAIMAGLLSDEGAGQSVDGLLDCLGNNLDWDLAGAWLSQREHATLGRAGVWAGQNIPDNDVAALYSLPTFDVDDDILGQVWMRQEPVWAPSLSPLAEFRRAATAHAAGFGAGLWFPV
ncbi:MAG TPA: GAF domain-containing protein, partial [Solirubrobacterales bacterium]